MSQNNDHSKTFHALGDKTRYQLFKLLSEKEQICVGQLAEKLGISSACVSQHMKVLMEAGLVTRTRTGQRVCYEISTDSPSKKLLSELIFN